LSLLDQFSLEGKVFVITGGLGLLGREHAKAIAEFGGNPVLLDLEENNWMEFSKEINRNQKVQSHFIRCDITNEGDIISAKDTILDKYNRIDGLINNATINPKVEKSKSKNFSRLENLDLEQWEREIKVGLTGAMLCSKIFGQEMVNNLKGVIVNISSDLGVIAPDQRIYKIDNIDEKNQPVKPITYSVIKHGIIGLTKYLSTYWSNKNIRVNSLSPGGVFNGQNEVFVNKLTNLIPMRRMANIDEYKAAIIFLCSDASSYMTGQNLIIDGGRSVW